MNMSVSQLVSAPAMVGRSRSVWHEIMDTVIEGTPRTAADEIAHNADHAREVARTLTPRPVADRSAGQAVGSSA